LLLKSVSDYVHSHVFALHDRGLKLEITRLGDDIGLWGCLASVLYAS